jgi:hypothetical protein
MKNGEKWSFWGIRAKKRPQRVKKVVLEVSKGSKRSFLVVLEVVFGPEGVKKVIFKVQGLKKVVFRCQGVQECHFWSFWRSLRGPWEVSFRGFWRGFGGGVPEGT